MTVPYEIKISKLLDAGEATVTKRADRIILAWSPTPYRHTLVGSGEYSDAGLAEHDKRGFAPLQTLGLPIEAASTFADLIEQAAAA